MPQRIDTVLADAPGDTVGRIDAGSEQVKPFLYAVHQLVDEARLVMNSNGWHIHAVDPTNVGVVDVSLHTSAFKQYDVSQEKIYGVNISQFRQTIKRARMNSDDILSMYLYDREIHTEVERDTNIGTVRFENTLRTLDPDSVRDADFKTNPRDYDDIDFAQQEFPKSTFIDAISYIVDDYEHVNIGNLDGVLGFWNGGDKDSKISPSTVTFDDIKPEIDEHSTFSSDYLNDILPGIAKIDPENVRLWYGDDIPLFIEAETIADGDAVLSLTYALAPRIR